jgi:hypothetical protein
MRTNADKRGQTRTNADKRGQTRTNADIYCVRIGRGAKWFSEPKQKNNGAGKGRSWSGSLQYVDFIDTSKV